MHAFSPFVISEILVLYVASWKMDLQVFWEESVTNNFHYQQIHSLDNNELSERL